MKSLRVLPSGSLIWRRSGYPVPDFELLGAEGVYATLTFLDEEKQLARVRTAEGTWTIKHVGILTPIVTLREEGRPTNLATFHPHAFRHGKLEFQDGPSFDWVRLHEAGPGGAFLDGTGMPLVHLQVHLGVDRTAASDLETCDVDLNLAPAAQDRQALLASMGWFLILLDHMKARDGVAAEMALRL